MVTNHRRSWGLKQPKCISSHCSGGQSERSRCQQVGLEGEPVAGAPPTSSVPALLAHPGHGRVPSPLSLSSPGHQSSLRGHESLNRAHPVQHDLILTWPYLQVLFPREVTHRPREVTRISGEVTHGPGEVTCVSREVSRGPGEVSRGPGEVSRSPWALWLFPQ